MPQLPRAMRGRDLRGQASENFLGDHLGGLTEELKRRFKDYQLRSLAVQPCSPGACEAANTVTRQHVMQNEYRVLAQRGR